MLQRKYLVFLSVLALLLIGWAVGWFWLADRLRADIDAFVETQRARGVVLRWDELSISGFPVRFDTDFTAPLARWDDVDRTITWTGADTSIRPFVEGPGTVSFRAPGRHRLEFSEAGANLQIESRSATLKGVLEFSDAGQIRGLRGRAEPFDLYVNEGPRIGVAQAAFDFAHPTRPGPTDPIHPDPVTARLSVVLNGIDLAALPLDASIARMLGSEITTFAGQLSLRGPLSTEDISPETLARWRDGGGTLEFESLELSWGPLRFAGDGTLALDSALQPEGAFSARISGLDTLIDLLEQRGEIRSQQAAIARIALAVFTRPSANGGLPEAKVPVTIQGRVLSIGPVPLLQLDPVLWD